jgi:hypothetical protein
MCDALLARFECPGANQGNLNSTRRFRIEAGSVGAKSGRRPESVGRQILATVDKFPSNCLFTRPGSIMLSE